ncbi:hypothetical protein DRO54_03075 [Candidatus Bathyarchaeota archaeon]|nr:MAG: hypothetical protein DRO54_03075 [Candidatus Bathyarchaeota archaeon]
MSKPVALGVLIFTVGLLLAFSSYSGLIKIGYSRTYSGIFDASTKGGWGYPYSGETYWNIGYLNFKAELNDRVSISYEVLEEPESLQDYPILFIGNHENFYAEPLNFRHLRTFVVGTTAFPKTYPPTYTLWLGVREEVSAGKYRVTIEVSGQSPSSTLTYIGLVITVIGVIIALIKRRKKVDSTQLE